MLIVFKKFIKFENTSKILKIVQTLFILQKNTFYIIK